MLSGKQSDPDLVSTDVFTRFSLLILDLLSFLKMTYPVSAGQGFIHHFMGHWQTVHNQIRYDIIPGRVAQSVTCLATDACPTADPGVASSIPARSHTFVEIDHEIISTVILLPSADSFKKGCCQLQAKVCAQITG